MIGKYRKKNKGTLSKCSRPKMNFYLIYTYGDKDWFRKPTAAINQS